MNAQNPVSSFLSSQDKVIIFLGLALVSLAGWLYLIYMAWAMENMHLVDMWMPPRSGMRAWTAWDFPYAFHHVVYDDDRHDDTNCRTHGHDVCSGKQTEKTQRSAVCQKLSRF